MQAQQEEVVTTYLRPTIVNLYGLTTNNNDQNTALQNMVKSSRPQKRFDELKLDIPKLILNLPELSTKPVIPLPPKKLDSTATEKEEKKYQLQLKSFQKDKRYYDKKIRDFNSEVQQRNSQRKKQIDQHLIKVSKEIIGEWFSRDPSGNMSTQLMEERAQFSASDEDVNIAKYSAVNRISAIGKELIQKTYVIIHAVDNIISYTDFYNQKDRDNQIILKYQNKDILPVLRKKEGYIMKEDSYLYKLNFNDSVFTNFVNRYWLSNNNLNQKKEKLENWKTATFPTTFHSSYSYSDERSQYTKDYLTRLNTDPEFKKQQNLPFSYSSSRIPLNQLIKAIGKRNFTAGILSANMKKIEDFKLKAGIYSAYPITSKIGTKEGIKKNDRWAIYEIHLDKKGNQVKKKTGYARITKVANNDSLATGNSPASEFRQHSGKEAHSGMLLEPKRGGILNFGFGRSLSIPNDQSIAGSYFDFDFRIFTFFKLGFNHTRNKFSITNFGGLQRDSIYYYNDTDSVENYLSGNFIGENDVSGKTNYFTFNFGREFLIGNRGNIIIEPKVGIGRALYEFNTESFADSSYTSTLPNTYSLLRVKTHVTMYSVEIGYHLLPKIIVSIKPAIIIRKAYKTAAFLKTPTNDNSAYRNVNYLGAKKQWGFHKMDKKNISFPINIGIKFKL